MSSRQRTLAGTGVLVAIVALPVVLVLAGVPTPSEVREAISYHQVSSRLILGLCAVVGWVAWVWLVTTFVLEVAEARARSVRGPRARGRLLGAAVAPAVVMVMGLLRSHAAGASPSPAAVVATTSSPPAPGASNAATSAANGPSSYAYVVRPGDNLYDLAEELYGDGEAWPVIWHASSDVPDPADIHVGQALTIPAGGLTSSGEALLSAQRPPVETASEETEVVVQPGDTLWSLSPDHNWEETWRLNQDQPEPNGATFDDPNLIVAGWTLEVPTTAATETEPGPAATPSSGQPPQGSPVPAPAPGSSEGAPSTLAPSSNGRSPVTSAPARRPSTNPREASGTANRPRTTAEPHVAHPRERSSWPEDLVGLGSALGAAGLVVEVNRLRRRRRRARPAPPNPPAPPGFDEASELLARQVVRADMEGLALIDRAIRLLGHELFAQGRARLLDSVREVRLSPDQLVVALDDKPVALPSFETLRRERAWRLRRHPGRQLGDQGALAPLPGLVSLGGHPERSEMVLVDLEHEGPLSVVGDDGAAAAALRAMAIEWGTAPWADQGQLVAVGLGDAFTPLGPRVSCTDNLAEAVKALEPARAQTESVLAQTGQSGLAQLRAAGEVLLPLGLTMVLVGPGQDAHLVETLAALAGPGLAVALAGELDAPLRFDVDGGQLSRRASVDRPAGGGTSSLVAAGVAPDVADGIGQVLAAAAGDEDERGHGRRGEDGDHKNERSREDAPAGAEVRVLGSPEVVGGPSPVRNRRARNLACYLALHPDGVPRARLEDAMDLRHPKSLYNAMAELRRALAVTEGGPPILASAERVAFGKGVNCDWWRFQEWAGSSSPQDWRRALELVRDAPLLGWEDEAWVAAYGWASMLGTEVVEVALRLGEERLAAGDPGGAEFAARQGQRAWPDDERLYQLRIRAAAAAGNRRAIEQAMVELREQLARVSGGEEAPSPETLRLYQSLVGRSRQRRSGPDAPG